jgi:hypothetical protein
MIRSVDTNHSSEKNALVTDEVQLFSRAKMFNWKWFIGKSQGEQEQSRQQRISMQIVVDFPTWYPLGLEIISTRWLKKKRSA